MTRRGAVDGQNSFAQVVGTENDLTAGLGDLNHKERRVAVGVMPDTVGDGGGRERAVFAHQLEEFARLDFVEQLQAALDLTVEQESTHGENGGGGGGDESRKLQGEAEGEGLHASW